MTVDSRLLLDKSTPDHCIPAMRRWPARPALAQPFLPWKRKLPSPIEATFQRVIAHLEPGGHFLYDFELVPAPYEDHDRWTGDWICGTDDVVIAWRKRTKHDPVTHVWRWLFIVEKFVDGRLVETEANERWGRTFTLEEALRYARATGFEEIRATDWLTEDPPSGTSRLISVQCRKPRPGPAPMGAG